MSNQLINSDIELCVELDGAPDIYDVINEEYPTQEYSAFNGFNPNDISSENIMNVPLSPIRVDWNETPEEIAEVNAMLPNLGQKRVSKKSFPSPVLTAMERKRLRMMGKVPRRTVAKKVRFAPTARKEPRHIITKEPSKSIKVKKENKGFFYPGKKTRITRREADKLKLKPARYHDGERVKDAGEFTLFHGRDGCFYARRGDNEIYQLPFHKGQASYVFSWCGGVERANKIKDWVKPEPVN